MQVWAGREREAIGTSEVKPIACRNPVCKHDSHDIPGKKGGTGVSETIIERLEKSIRLFAADEREIWPNQCEEVLGAVRDLQAALAETRLPDSFIDCILLSASAPAEAPVDSSTLISRMVDLEFARAQADDVRLALAAYQPHGRSKAMRYLQARQYLVGQLRRLLAVAAKVLATPECAATPTVRPDYLQVVTTNDAKEECS